MDRTRVYQVAHDLGMDSKTLMRHLASLGIAVRSASSRLDQPEIRRVIETLGDHPRPGRALAPAAPAIGPDPTQGQVPAQPSRPRRAPHVLWEYPYDWSDERYWVGPDAITTAEAARACRVSPATIRKWVERVHLRVIGRRGRTHVFEAAAVLRAHQDIKSRNLQPRPVRDDDRGSYMSARSDARNGVSSANLYELVTTAEAARNAGVPQSTVRSWIRRGHLRPVDRKGRSPLLRRSDVLRVARRAPYRPPRRPRAF